MLTVGPGSRRQPARLLPGCLKSPRGAPGKCWAIQPPPDPGLLSCKLRRRTLLVLTVGPGSRRQPGKTAPRPHFFAAVHTDAREAVAEHGAVPGRTVPYGAGRCERVLVCDGRTGCGGDTVRSDGRRAKTAVLRHETGRPVLGTVPRGHRPC